MNPKDEIAKLRREIEQHGHNYYVLDRPTISDFEYDALLRRLIELEQANPELVSPDSPTQKIGGKILTSFSPVTHEVPLESLNDVFSFGEVQAFVAKVIDSAGDGGFIVEPKIDGLSVALYYDNGIFVRGATRGDGVTGEDVTENLKTIKSIPRTLKDGLEHLVVRGEVYMPRSVFQELNEQREVSGEQLMANPRNAAAGSLRQLDPKIAASRKLEVLVFNVQTARGAEFHMHKETLDYLKQLGFKVVDYVTCSDADECIQRIEWLGDNRETYEYDIDGAVIKINALDARTRLGSTSKAPRWAAAYKYPPEKKETKLLEIVIQVGRTGVLTPKAVVEPVRLAGTTVTNATLHNQDFISEKDIRIGDTVMIQKAGEIKCYLFMLFNSFKPLKSSRF